MAIASVGRTSGRTAAAGITSKAAISKTPTTLIATATTIASASVRRRGLMPLARAKSGFSVAVNKAGQRHAISANPYHRQVKGVYPQNITE